MEKNCKSVADVNPQHDCGRAQRIVENFLNRKRYSQKPLREILGNDYDDLVNLPLDKKALELFDQEKEIKAVREIIDDPPEH